ncbi:hypothetical protein TIFTF001_004339 [Ficus carica]|uniref:Uncharacterized protein n=1 Tax=Ficus carica TaxID=3494 RepID=A0AA88CX17_FICCA|nr:hypothetical protein TIFTF001_004339 [Ficus carica]
MPPAILFHRPVACLRLRPFRDFSVYELLGLCLGGEKIWTRRGFRWRRSGREREIGIGRVLKSRAMLVVGHRLDVNGSHVSEYRASPHDFSPSLWTIFALCSSKYTRDVPEQAFCQD